MLKDSIKDYVDSNYVIINEIFRSVVGNQLVCYIKHYQQNFKYYVWITINDIDEYIFLEEKSKHSKIQHFLDELIFNDTDNIILIWKHYDDKKIFYKKNDNYSLLQRFTHHNFD